MVAPINYLAAFPNLDLGQQYGSLAQTLMQNRQLNQAAQQEQAKQAEAVRAQEAAAQMQAQYSNDLKEAFNNPTQTAWAKLVAKYPQQRQALGEAAKMQMDEATEKEFWKGAEISTALENGDVATARKQIDFIVEAKINGGQDPGIYKQVQAALNSGDIGNAKAVTNMALSMADPEKFKKVIDSRKEILQMEMQRTEFPALFGKKVAELSKSNSEAESARIEAKYAEQEKKLKLKKMAKELQDISPSGIQVGEILPDGTAVMLLKDKTSKVLGPDGIEVSGPERAQKIREALEFGAKMKGIEAGSKEAGKEGQALAVKARDSANKVRTYVSNLDLAINAVRSGASSGVIENKFPSIKQASIELDALRKTLALDDLSSGSFGIISDSDIRFATEKAIPPLQGKALENHLLRKKAAQEKILKHLDATALFLSKPGNTLNMWLTRQPENGQSANSASAPKPTRVIR